MTIQRIKRYFLSRPARNLYFWLVITALSFPASGDRYYLFPVLLLINLSAYAIPSYINNTLLIQKFFVRRRYVLYVILLAALIGLATAISYFLTNYFNRVFPELATIDNKPGDMTLMDHVMTVVFSFFIMASVKFTSDAVLNYRKLELLEKQQLLSELETLKSQVNPHFLFNSLNTIYGLSSRHEDNETADAVLKLSDILRYVLYDSNVQTISLKQEISFLESYMDFAKLRNSSAEIVFNADAEISDQRMAPLILLPFIENAIKHGLGKHIKASWIRVRLSMSSNTLYFECSNSNYNRNRFAAEKTAGGIGLKNVKRRLDLLYGSRHTLTIDDDINEFRVRLNLTLS